jgi:hypothetical protein
MAEFTKEQLIERAKQNIRASGSFPGDRVAAMDLRLAEIALAALTEQPVGFYRASRHGDGYYLANNMEQTPGTIPLYRLPLLEGLK